MKCRTLRVQPLELRALLTIDVELDLVTGSLNIQGTIANDVIEITSNALTVNVKASEGASTQTYTYVRSLVRSITARGGEGDDQLTNSSDLSVTFYGQDGHDMLIGGSADDTLRGGYGNDTIRGGGGDDYLYGDFGDDELLGNSGNDKIYADDGNDRLRGGDGDDVLFGGNGRDQVFGDTGHDILSGGDLRDYLYGGPGDDILRGGDGDDILRGDLGNDQLFGDSGNDTIHGDDGDDELRGDVGDDMLGGGLGADFLDGGSGSDTLIGDEGDDRLWGREGSDVLRGGDGNDDLRGDAGRNEIFGDAGNDLLIGGPDQDILWGGVGDDVLRGYGAHDNLYGEAGSDQLFGDDGKDELEGGIDDDQVNGGEGSDLILGGGGNDLLVGEAGDDVIRGDTGHDVIYSGTGNDDVNGNEGDDQIYGGDGDDELRGGPGSDSIRGGSGNDHLRGLDGNDSLNGDEGSDILVGGQGSDMLYGGEGNDLLVGGENDDRLWGGNASDLLIGGTTVYDDNDSQLRYVLDAWFGAIAYQGLSDALYLSNKAIELRTHDTVFDDGAADELEGDSGWDSFYWFASDRLTDRSPSEPVASGDLSDGGWAKRLYLDALGKLPTENQVASMRQRLELGTSRAGIVLELLQSNEFRAEELRRIYFQTFGSEIPASHLTLQLLNLGLSTTLERLWAEYLASADFYANHGGNDAGVIQAIYNVVVRRTASDDEIGAWLEVLAQSSLVDVAHGLITSPEVQAARIGAWYRDYLHRAPSGSQLAGWLQQLEAGKPSEEVRASLLVSLEYVNQPFFDAADFGATGNDATKDTSALQMAFDIADLAGNSLVYLRPGVYMVEGLNLRGSNLKLIGTGTLRLADRSNAVGVLTVDGSDNVLSYFKVDGNQSGMHTGRAEGLRLVGDNNWVFRVEVANTYQDDLTEPSGQNFVTIGNYNTLIETRSLNAGHSGYRQIGEGTLYRDIVSLDYRVKGFNGSGDGTSFVVDGGYFETDKPEHWLGLNSFQVDPGPGQLLGTVVLRNVTAIGPRNSTGVTTAAAKIALVTEVIIENSSFISTAENHSSLRFAEGVGRVVLKNVYMTRNLFMQQNTHDGSGLDDPMDELYMVGCVIGDGVHRPLFAMERIRVGILSIKDSRFIGFTKAAIDWQSPETEYSSIRVRDTFFRGHNEDEVTYDVITRNGGELSDPAKRVWSGIRRRNSGRAGAAFTPS